MGKHINGRLIGACLATVASMGMVSCSARKEAKTDYLVAKSFASYAMARSSKPVFRVASVKGHGRVRIYLIHGMKTDHRQWGLAPFNDLQKPGEQVVLIDLPKPTPDFFNDRGAGYCKAFVRWMRQTDAQLDAQYGRPERKSVAGISYGGFHALVAAANMPQLDAYAALSPVTDISVLPEFRWQSNAACSPLTSPPKKRGIIAWSLDDKRVNATLIRVVAKAAHARRLVTNGIGHWTSPAQARLVAAFLP